MIAMLMVLAVISECMFGVEIAETEKIHVEKLLSIQERDRRIIFKLGTDDASNNGSIYKNEHGKCLNMKNCDEIVSENSNLNGPIDHFLGSKPAYAETEINKNKSLENKTICLLQLLKKEFTNNYQNFSHKRVRSPNDNFDMDESESEQDIFFKTELLQAPDDPVIHLTERQNLIENTLKKRAVPKRNKSQLLEDEWESVRGWKTQEYQKKRNTTNKPAFHRNGVTQLYDPEWHSVRGWKTQEYQTKRNTTNKPAFHRNGVTQLYDPEWHSIIGLKTKKYKTSTVNKRAIRRNSAYPPHINEWQSVDNLTTVAYKETPTVTLFSSYTDFDYISHHTTSDSNTNESEDVIFSGPTLINRNGVKYVLKNDQAVAIKQNTTELFLNENLTVLRFKLTKDDDDSAYYPPSPTFICNLLHGSTPRLNILLLVVDNTFNYESADYWYSVIILSFYDVLLLMGLLVLWFHFYTRNAPILINEGTFKAAQLVFFGAVIGGAVLAFIGISIIHGGVEDIKIETVARALLFIRDVMEIARKAEKDFKDVIPFLDGLDGLLDNLDVKLFHGWDHALRDAIKSCRDAIKMVSDVVYEVDKVVEQVKDINSYVFVLEKLVVAIVFIFLLLVMAAGVVLLCIQMFSDFWELKYMISYEDQEKIRIYAALVAIIGLMLIAAVCTPLMLSFSDICVDPVDVVTTIVQNQGVPLHHKTLAYYLTCQHKEYRIDVEDRPDVKMLKKSIALIKEIGKTLFFIPDISRYAKKLDELILQPLDQIEGVNKCSKIKPMFISLVTGLCLLTLPGVILLKLGCVIAAFGVTGMVTMLKLVEY